MERRPPDFEDEKIRAWRATPEEQPGLSERDPTTLSIDMATEEIFESRVYAVNADAYLRVFADVLNEHPDVPAELLLARLAQGLDNSTFRFLAKRTRGKDELTWIQITDFGGQRGLIERGERQPEASFRESVAAFEGDALAGEVVYEPAVVTVEEWSRYDERQPLGPPS